MPETTHRFDRSSPPTTLLLLCYAALATLSAVNFFVALPVYVNTASFSLLIIYAGSWRSVAQMCTNFKRVHVDKEEGAAASIDTIGKEEAMWFPIMAGCVLCGLYALIKTFGKEVVNPLLLCYMGVGGALSLKQVLTLVPALKQMDSKKLFRLKSQRLDLDYEVSGVDFIALALSYSVVGLYLWTKNWLINNVVATFFCLHALEMMFLGSFKVGFLLLSLLFCYDIFFVFGTDVMLTVAKNIDAPIKLLFPKDWTADPPQFSLLGLGDIVLPGIFISMCLRFDCVLAFNRQRA